MKALILLAAAAIAGCASAEAAVNPGEAAAVHAHVIALRANGALVNPAPAPELRCGGDRVITHGDGHTTPCGGCADCRRKAEVESNEELVVPATFRVAAAGCPAAGCPATVAQSGQDGASGACGAGAGPLRKAIAARPVRGAVKAIRERRPVRRLLGGLFGRGFR